MQYFQEGMVDVLNKTCGHPTCTKLPSFDLADTKNAEFCVQHAQEGMVNIVAEIGVGIQVAPRLPSHGVEGTKKTEFQFCTRHARDGMVDVVSRRRGHPNNPKLPLYGLASSRKADLCAKQAQEGYGCKNDQKKVRPSRVQRKTIVRHGTEGTGNAEYDSPHAKEGMFDIPTKRCSHPSCRTKPTYSVEGTRERFLREMCS